MVDNRVSQPFWISNFSFSLLKSSSWCIIHLSKPILERKIMTVTTATFRVDGRNYCNIARDLVLDQEWRKGLKLLVDNFEGMTNDIAFHILKGTHILVGFNNDISMIVEVDESYQEQISDIYCHDMFYQNKQLYRFVKVIEHREIQSHVHNSGVKELPDWDKYVQQYMMDDDCVFFDVSTSEQRFRACIAERVDNNSLPLWFSEKEFSSSAKAYTDKYAPYQSTVDALIAEKAAKNAPIQPVSESDWYKNGRIAHAIQTANDYGYETVELFSETLRKKVLKAIGERNVEWRELHVKTEDVDKVIKYPYELALSYALIRTKLSSYAPKWEPVCEQGIKMENDSRIHSDLWLALGNDFDGSEYIYTTPENIILAELVKHMQKEVFPAGEFVTLNSAGLKTFKGHVATPRSEVITKNSILVIPHAGPEFELKARQAGLVVCEVGGKLAHLVIVGREFGLPMVRMEDACCLFEEGVELTLDFEKATISIGK